MTHPPQSEAHSGLGSMLITEAPPPRDTETPVDPPPGPSSRPWSSPSDTSQELGASSGGRFHLILNPLPRGSHYLASQLEGEGILVVTVSVVDGSLLRTKGVAEEGQARRPPVAPSPAQWDLHGHIGCPGSGLTRLSWLSLQLL